MVNVKPLCYPDEFGYLSYSVNNVQPASTRPTLNNLVPK